MLLLAPLCSRMVGIRFHLFYLHRQYRQTDTRKEAANAAVITEARSSSVSLEWEGDRKVKTAPWPVQLSVFSEAAALFEADEALTYLFLCNTRLSLVSYL